MSHMIESALFVGQPAWHGLGVVLANAPSIAEALTLSGLDWKVESQPAFIVDGVDGFGLPQYRTVPDTNVMVRSTDRKIFGTMGRVYQPLQNSEAFARFAPLIDSGEATIEAAGSLDEGRKVWVLAAIKNAIGDVLPGDAVKQYVLLAHSHDGTLRITCGITDTRVVCNNTLQIALDNDASRMLSRKHTKNAIVDLDKLIEGFDLARGQLTKDLEKFRFLASKKCDDKNAIRYIRALLGGAEKADTDDTIHYVDAVAEKIQTGVGSDIPGVRGTMWGAFNAATEFLTHNAGRSQDTRVASGWFGANAQKTARALDLAVTFANTAPDATALGRECYQNSATASADFAALLGGSYVPADVAAE